MNSLQINRIFWIINSCQLFGKVCLEREHLVLDGMDLNNFKMTILSVLIHFNAFSVQLYCMRIHNIKLKNKQLSNTRVYDAACINLLF